MQACQEHKSHLAGALWSAQAVNLHTMVLLTVLAIGGAQHTPFSCVCLAVHCSATSLAVCPQVTAMAAVPAMISDIVAHHAQLPGSYPGVRKVLLGAASADSTLLLRLHCLFPYAQARLPHTFLAAAGDSAMHC